MKTKIYLDNNATTQVDPRVVDVVIKDLKDHYGNPSSIHAFGRDSRSRLTRARDVIAEVLHVNPQELIFTSGGTEAINMLIRGLFAEKPGGHIISSSVEHSSVYSTVKLMEARGCAVTMISPGLWGAVKPEAVRDVLRPETRLITLLAVNNETGVKTDIESIAEIALERGIPFIVDGVALLGKELFTIPEGVSAMCFSGHKLHAPKGIGMAWVQKKLKFAPLLVGGVQEYGRRGGTENVSGIIGFAEAVRLLKSELPAASQRMQYLRDKFERSIMKKLPGIRINGSGPRVCSTSNLAFEGIEGETLLAALDLEGLAASHGSACSSGALEPSRILLNMGLSMQLAGSSLRFSLSRFTTEDEIDRAVEIIHRAVNRLRG